MELDNFQFKPITNGLGFDKKAEEKKPNLSARVSQVKSQALKTEEPEKVAVEQKSIDWDQQPSKSSLPIADMMKSLPPSIDLLDERKPVKKTEEVTIYKPVGRIDYNAVLNKELTSTEKELNIPNEEKVDISLNNTLEKAFPQVGFRRPFFHQVVQVQEQYVPVYMNLTSALLDGLVVAGLTALFLVGVVLITGVDLIAVLMHPGVPLRTSLDVFAIAAGVQVVYYMASRGIWGSTLGDWAFDIQLGINDEHLHWYYPFQVVFRMLLIMATGYVVLPILSFILKKDLAGKASGAPLYMRTY